MFHHKKFIELSHVLTPTSPTWEGVAAFTSSLACDYESCTTTTKFRVQKLCLHAGVGTHIDAPAHCIPGGRTVEMLSLRELIAPCLVIDVSAQPGPTSLVSVETVQQFEELYQAKFTAHVLRDAAFSCSSGRAEKERLSPAHPGQDRRSVLKDVSDNKNLFTDSIVLFKTNWSRKWSQPEQYRNDLQFPAISGEAAQYLVDRGALAIGIDTLSPDRPGNQFPTHDVVLGANRYLIENLTNLDRLPPIGATLMVMPLALAGATEAPARVIGIVDL